MMKVSQKQGELLLQTTVDRLLPTTEPLRVLDAGCGSAAHIRLPETAILVGIDISQRQLDRNVSLHEKILGDIQTFALPAESFDAEVCWDVLEHLKEPEAALRRLSSALKPGGILILAYPNPDSLKGLVTRFTPHWFHIWFYRRVRSSERAGTQDYGPFPTTISRRIAAGAICRLAASQGLAVELQMAFSGTRLSRRRAVGVQVAELALDGLSLVLRLSTLGRYRGELGECRFVLRKPDGSPPATASTSS
jgi:SAM-dependent methyltransferase